MSDWIHYISWIKELWYFWLFGIVGVGILTEFVDGKPHPILRAMKMLAMAVMTVSWVLGLLSLLWWLGDWVLSFFAHFLGSGSATPWSFSTWYQSLGWLGKWWLYYGSAEVAMLCVATLVIVLEKGNDRSITPFISWFIFSLFALFAMLVISTFGGVINAFLK
ncbi:MAG: hypothetical protein PHU06_01510 [Gallionella sp.]|nr:hypothetical protein [Gallionella sp.]MDD4957875.1 hypothetical protein [Gallionella sp.]